MARLNSLRPDRDRLISQLLSELGNIDFDPNNPQVQKIWNVMLKASTGRKLAGLFGTIGEYSQFSIESAYKERYIQTARLDSSIRAAVRSASVRIARKLPAYTDVTLTRTDDYATSSLTLNKFTTFSSGAIRFYLRNTLTFDAGVQIQTARLYVGIPTLVTYSANGLDFQIFTSDEDKFTVSDGLDILADGTESYDIDVMINGTPITVTRKPLWSFKSDTNPAVQDRTLITGELELLFGTKDYGIRPASGETVQIRYVVCNGSSDNDPAFSGTITPAESTTLVTVSNASGITGGADEVDPETYRVAGPLQFAAMGRGVTKDDWNGLAASYPGIVDALILGQRETHPSDRRWMGILQASLIKADGTTLSSTEFASFRNWFSSQVNNNLVIVSNPAVASNPPLKILAICAPSVDLQYAESAIRQAITAYFAIKYGVIGSTVFRDDIARVARQAVPGIKHLVVVSPVADIVTRANSTKVSASLGTGTLVAGTYNHAIVPVVQIYNGAVLQTELGAPSRTSLTLTATGGVLLTWTPVIGALQYQIWGRTVGANTMKLMATVSSDVLSYLDNGTAVPSGTATLDTLPSPNATIRYPALSSLIVSTTYDTGR